MLSALSIAAVLIAAPQGVGTTVQTRGAGGLSCATAFRPENRVVTESWIAGYWTAWDMARVNAAAPLANGSDLNGIVGEVERACSSEPSSTLVMATLAARSAVAKRSAGARQ